MHEGREATSQLYTRRLYWDEEVLVSTLAQSGLEDTKYLAVVAGTSSLIKQYLYCYDLPTRPVIPTTTSTSIQLSYEKFQIRVDLTVDAEEGKNLA